MAAASVLKFKQVNRRLNPGGWRMRAIYRLQNTHGLALQTLGDGSDPEVVLRDCADEDVHMRRVLCELGEAVLEQVGKDQTDRLRHALADALTQYR